MDTVLTVGRYGIDEWLASGATGVVFRGYDRVLDRPVAIKSLRRELAKGSAAQGWRDRFRRRARAAGQLFHPNIATILDFGEDHDIPFIAMEYIDGSRLDRLLKASGRLAPRRAINIMLQILDGLKYAHETGVLHLDLKPSIILLLADDRVKVADFGTTLADAPESPATGETAGPASYATPEQLGGGPLDCRTDIFTAGALLFEMLSCAKPFRDADVDEISAQIASRQRADVCMLNPEVPSAVRDVIDTALSADPGHRFASAGEFARALHDAALFRNNYEMTEPPAQAARLPGCEPGWDPKILRQVEADLATHLGPVAPFAVRRAAKRASDVAALFEELAACIENEGEREEFLRSGLRLTAATSDQTAYSQSGESDPKLRKTLATDPPDATAIDAMEAKLAQFVGPIARILVKQELRNFRSMPELYLNLAEYISDNSERAAFLALGNG